MSINSMVDVSVANHLTQADGEKENASVSLNLKTLSSALALHVAPQQAIQKAGQDAVQDAWDRITTYIPSEIIAAYLAVLSIIPSSDAQIWDVRFFYIFLIMAPLAVVTGIAGKIRSITGAFPPLRTYSLFSILAAPIAFVAWGLGIPNSGLLANFHLASWWAAIAIVLVSLILGQLSALFD